MCVCGGGTLTFARYRGSDYFLEFTILNFATGEPGKGCGYCIPL